MSELDLDAPLCLGRLNLIAAETHTHTSVHPLVNMSIKNPKYVMCIDVCGGEGWTYSIPSLALLDILSRYFAGLYIDTPPAVLATPPH